MNVAKRESFLPIAKINAIESALLEMPQAECPVRHIFGDGIYIREVTLPAGVAAVGHHQNFEQMNTMLRGVVTMINDDGTTTFLDATKSPISFMAKAGRKIGYIHETVIWHNIYKTDEKDVEKLEALYLTKSDNFQSFALKCAENLKLEHDVKDFFYALECLGVSPEQVKEESENELDQIPFPSGSYKCEVKDSAIHGKGLFATGNISAGEVIAPARLSGKRTPAGRFTNHTRFSNASMIKDGDDIYLVATRDIKGMTGGQKGEEITINYYDTRLICQA